MSRSPYIVDGIKIERLETPGPYSLRVYFQKGIILEIARGHNPVLVRAAHNHVAHNPHVIRRIEMHDSSGCLETIWDASWKEI